MTTYQASRFVGIESSTVDKVIIKNQLSGHRLEISQQAYEFFFKQHRSMQNESFQNHPGYDRIFQILVKNQFYQPASENELEVFIRNNGRVFPRETLFSCPRLSLDEAVDFAILGVPYASNKLFNQGGFRAPDAIREASLQLPYRTDNHGVFPGWYDLAKGDRILSTCRIQDAGNIRILPGEDPSRIFQRVAHEVARIKGETGAIPLILGGDHSITYATCSGCQTAPLTLIMFDAHPDADVYHPNLGIHHANFVSALRQQSPTQDVINIGVRGISGMVPSPDWIPGDLAPKEIVDRLRSRLPKGSRIYISIDLDVLDPAFFPYVQYPEVDGITSAKILEVLRMLVDDFKIEGIDITEFMPDLDKNKFGCNFLVRFVVQLLTTLFKRV